jgi:hypothetical protein
MTLSINVILVPQGREYQAVCQGLKQINSCQQLLAIPMGIEAVTKYLGQQQLQINCDLGFAEALRDRTLSRVLVMGLCGSLSPEYEVGDVVLYQDCTCSSNCLDNSLLCLDNELTTSIQQHLKEKVSLVRALTSDRLIHEAREKLHLAQLYQASVVDMEGYAIVQTLQQQGIAVAMLRVVSDSTSHNIPDLSSAIAPDGTLQLLPLAIAMLRQPLAAIQLIKDGLKGLKVLAQITTELLDK